MVVPYVVRKFKSSLSHWNTPFLNDMVDKLALTLSLTLLLPLSYFNCILFFPINFYYSYKANGICDHVGHSIFPTCLIFSFNQVMVCHCKRPVEGRFGCGDECLNRMLNIECVQGTCPCGDLCSNQQVFGCFYL